jgi:hypothetical protein
LAGPVLKIVYLLMRWLFGLTVLVFRGDEAKDAELLVLRHENAMLRHHAPRIVAGDLGTQRIHRRPVLSGLINEYMQAA